MPLACSEPAEAQLEAQRIAAMVELDEYRLAASEVGLGEEETAEHTMRLVTKIDSLALKLFQTANGTERNAAERTRDLPVTARDHRRTRRSATRARSTSPLACSCQSRSTAPQTCPSPCRLFKP